MQSETLTEDKLPGRVAAIIVTYHPEEPVFFRLLELLGTQVELVVIVDNGSGAEFCQTLSSRRCSTEHFIPLGSNQGIAAAQNAGIAYAKQHGATHVVFFDHDSAPAADLVARLTECSRRLENQGIKVGAVGACYLDERQQNPPPFIRVRNFSLQRCAKPENGDAVPVDYLIASGCFISMAALDEVGGMRAELFVDYVDIEWGLRALKHGFQNFGCFSAKMAHSLGDEPIILFGKGIPLHSSLRHYYLFRNAAYLYRLKEISFEWKFVDAWRLLLKFGFYSLFAKPQWQHCKMMGLGFWHGMSGRMGQLQQ